MVLLSTSPRISGLLTTLSLKASFIQYVMTIATISLYYSSLGAFKFSVSRLEDVFCLCSVDHDSPCVELLTSI